MARRPSKREDAVTTEPVADYDIEDQFVGGMDLATALTIFTFLFILGGIGFVYYHLKESYDVGKDPYDHYQAQDLNVERGRAEGGGSAPADEGGDAPADEGGGEEAAPADAGSGDSTEETTPEESGDDGFGN